MTQKLLFALSLTSALITPHHASEPLPEISWNELTIGNKVGQGGFGEVFQAKWRGLEVAVKKLTLGTLTGNEKTDFERETQAMWKVQFRNVLRLIGVCTEVNHYAMVVEFMRGGSLYDRLRHGGGAAFREKDRWDVAIRVAQGLADLHGDGVIHRDLKSHNVLLDEYRRARIADFGLARVRTATTASITGGKGGSIRWSAPECFQFPSRITDRTDMYSYGMILWELLTGEIPFHQAPNEMIVMGLVQNGTRETIPADCPSVWREIIEACWKQDRDQRPSAVEVVQRLTEARPASPLSVWLPVVSAKGAVKAGGYLRYPGVYEDWIIVMKNYERKPVKGYDVAAVDVVWNPDMNDAFKGAMRLLQQRRGNPRYVVDWTKTTEGSRRMALQQELAELKVPYVDYEAEDCPDVQLMPLWHGTQEEKLSSLLSTGYNAFCDTDEGYFGKGAYTTPEAEYAYMYANGCRPQHQENGRLVLNWGVSYNSYPILDVDYDAGRRKLVGAVPPEYDMRYIPVVQTAPGSPDYRPTAPGETFQYREFMTANYGQLLPRYVVTLSKSRGEVDGQDQIMFKSVRMPEGALMEAYLRADERFRVQVGQEEVAEITKIRQEETVKRVTRLKLEQKLRWSREAVVIISSVRSFIPELAEGHEEVYLRFLRGKLVYKPNKKNDIGRKEFPIASLWDPLSGTFDIRGCGDSALYLQISTGFRTRKELANANIIEVWIVPQFVLQKDPRAKAFNDFLQTQENHRNKPFAILFTWGGWDDLSWHEVTGVCGNEFDALSAVWEAAAAGVGGVSAEWHELRSVYRLLVGGRLQLSLQQ